MDELAADRPPTRGERVGQGFLYVFFGIFVVGCGWFLGSLYITASHAPMAIFGAGFWYLGLFLVLPVLLAFFVTRPLRTVHRWVWAATAATGCAGFFRVWSWTWSAATAVLATMVVVIPRGARPRLGDDDMIS